MYLELRFYYSTCTMSSTSFSCDISCLLQDEIIAKNEIYTVFHNATIIRNHTQRVEEAVKHAFNLTFPIINKEIEKKSAPGVCDTFIFHINDPLFSEMRKEMSRTYNDVLKLEYDPHLLEMISEKYEVFKCKVTPRGSISMFLK